MVMFPIRRSTFNSGYVLFVVTKKYLRRPSPVKRPSLFYRAPKNIFKAGARRSSFPALFFLHILKGTAFLEMHRAEAPLLRRLLYPIKAIIPIARILRDYPWPLL
jgi:hypothetical protein